MRGIETLDTAPPCDNTEQRMRQHNLTVSRQFQMLIIHRNNNKNTDDKKRLTTNNIESVLYTYNIAVV